MKVLLLFLCVVLFIAFTTAIPSPWPVEDSSDGIENKELSRKRRMIQPPPCPIIQFSRQDMPTVWDNMDNAINVDGKPTTLNRVTDKAQIAKNRHASGCPALTAKMGNAKAQGISCDEYPFASSTQGGTGAVIAMVDAIDNNAQGGTLKGFYESSSIKNGGCYTVQLIP